MSVDESSTHSQNIHAENRSRVIPQKSHENGKLRVETTITIILRQLKKNNAEFVQKCVCWNVCSEPRVSERSAKLCI